jgi:hypothetical protein
MHFSVVIGKPRIVLLCSVTTENITIFIREKEKVYEIRLKRPFHILFVLPSTEKIASKKKEEPALRILLFLKT